MEQEGGGITWTLGKRDGGKKHKKPKLKKKIEKIERKKKLQKIEKWGKQITNVFVFPLHASIGGVFLRTQGEGFLCLNYSGEQDSQHPPHWGVHTCIHKTPEGFCQKKKLLL